MTASGPALRLLPKIDELNRFFWTSGSDGRLRLQRCSSCGRFVHPPLPRCPYCLARGPAPEVVSGRGTVHAFTVNHQQWIPGSDDYVIALVTLAEQDDVRLTTNLVGVGAGDVCIGMPVEVTFEHQGDVWLPLFAPVTAHAAPDTARGQP